MFSTYFRRATMHIIEGLSITCILGLFYSHMLPKLEGSVSKSATFMMPSLFKSLAHPPVSTGTQTPSSSLYNVPSPHINVVSHTLHSSGAVRHQSSVCEKRVYCSHGQCLHLQILSTLPPCALRSNTATAARDSMWWTPTSP